MPSSQVEHPKAQSTVEKNASTKFDFHNDRVSSFRRKDETVSTGWGKKLRAALRPSWLATDAKLTGNSSLDPEEDCSYDTGIDLTEADFIADDMDADDSAG